MSPSLRMGKELHMEQEKSDKQKKPSLLVEIFDWVDSVVFSVILMILVFTLVFRIVGIKGESMENTVLDGEKVIISDVFYTPKQGDIVVISRDYFNSLGQPVEGSEPIIKRVIATEGQTVNIDFESGIVYVDDQPLDEPYTKTPTNRQDDVQFPLTVEDDCVFVLGDNRAISKDSRDSSIGLVNERYILGKVILRVYPFDRFGSLD